MRANRVRYRNRTQAGGGELAGVVDLSTDVALLKNEFLGLKNDVASLASAFQVFSDEYRKGKQWNWALLTPLIGVGTVMMALLVLLVQNQISPLGSDMRGITTAVALLNDRIKEGEVHSREQDAAISTSATKDARSETDRSDLRGDTLALRSQVSENSAGLKELKSVFERTAAEIETQIAHVEQVRNEQVGTLEWKLALLWPNVMKQPYPVINDPKDAIAIRDGGR